MTVPNFSSYGNYASSNYGVNSLLFTVGNFDYYFSYETLVAFRHPRVGMVVHTNDWGPTTGKHLNWIDDGEKEDKAARLTCEQFQQVLAYVEEYDAVARAA